MPTGPTGHDLDGFELAEFLGADIHLFQEDAPGLLAHAAQNCVANGSRLLKDFLEHEMLVAALLRHDGIPENVRDRPLDSASVEIRQVHALGSEDRQVA